MAKDKNYMTEEERYLDILNTYGISSDKTLEEIHAILRDKKSKHHPDKGGDIKIFQEINNDDTYIVQTLMKKYGRTYVYPVNNTRTGGSTSGNTSSNNGYNTSPNGNNNFGNNNNNKTDESLRKEKQDFYNYVMFVKKSNSHIPEIVQLASHFLINIINQIVYFDELQMHKNEFFYLKQLYEMLYAIRLNKEKYENDEINVLSDKAINDLNADRMKSIIHNDSNIIAIWKSYAAKIEPIIKKIEEEIEKKTKPVLDILNAMKNYRFIKFSFTSKGVPHIISLDLIIFSIEEITSLKKVDGTLNENLNKIRDNFVKFLESDINTKDAEYNKYVTQMRYKATNALTFYDLNQLMKEYNDYVLKYIKNEVERIKMEIHAFITQNNISSLYRSSLGRILENNISSKEELNKLIERIEFEEVAALRDSFNLTLFEDKLPFDIRNKYTSRIYDAKTVAELKAIIDEYNTAKNNYYADTAEAKSRLDEAKQGAIAVLNAYKEKNKGKSICSRVDYCIKLIDTCRDFDDIQEVLNRFKKDAFDSEKTEFSFELSNDFLNGLVSTSSYYEYINNLNSINTIDELNRLRQDYSDKIGKKNNPFEDDNQSVGGRGSQ